jgi:hypothetical protein
MAGGMSWKEFEAIVARLQRTFNKAGTVTCDEKIRGKISGRPRQIDICIRTTIGTENVLIIVECRKLNRKVDVRAVEAFAGVMKDVGAQMGIMVSTAGFSKAAYRRAAGENVSLYRYKDTLKEAWPSGLETNVLLEIWELTAIEARFILADGTEELITSDEELHFFGRDGKQLGGFATVLRKIWDKSTTEKREWAWVCECDCTTPERPEIRKLRVGAQSKLVRGIRKGRIHFEGLINESEGHAKVEGWKMVFDGALTPWPKEKPLPLTPSYSIMIRSVFVKTENPNSRALQGLIYDGAFWLSVKGAEVMNLPVKSTYAVKVESAKPKPAS